MDMKDPDAQVHATAVAMQGKVRQSCCLGIILQLVSVMLKAIEH